MDIDKRSSEKSLNWLLEKETPEVRYLALRDLLHLSYDDPELKEARETAHRQGPISHILEKMDPLGYWLKPGPGYGPKYKSTVWSLMLLAQLGADIREDERIANACNYLLDHTLASGGQFSYNAQPSGTIDCLQGNLCWALMKLGCDDARIYYAYEWMARSATGDGIAPASDRKAPVRYYAYKCAPNFACGANNKMPCAWGAAKVILAFGVLPKTTHSPMIDKAIQMGLDFFLSTNLAKADFPNGLNDHPSRNWWKFGFPVFYVTDLLQVADALASLGAAHDPRLESTLKLIHEKQDDHGRWPLEYDYSGKTWRSYGKLNEPNKWVTLRALRVLYNN